MFAVVRLVQDHRTHWRVLRASGALHQRYVLEEAARIANEARLDPRLIDAIYGRPTVPMDMMHAFWCRPDKLLDIRPTDPTSRLRNYRIDSRLGDVIYEELDCDLGEYEAHKHAPLGLPVKLPPYGSERFFGKAAH